MEVIYVGLEQQDGHTRGLDVDSISLGTSLHSIYRAKTSGAAARILYRFS